MTECADKNIAHKKDRIEWIDIAKGITIILMIIAHTIPIGNVVRNIIYSFHMPLFIILSGYTFNYNNGSRIFNKIIRDINRLIIPTLVTVGISILVLFMQSHFDIKSLEFIIKQSIEGLIWAAAVSSKYADLGFVWFLLTLFWIRTIARICIKKLSLKNSIVIFGLLGILGIQFGGAGYELPQNFDVVFVGLLFFAVGLLWNKYQNSINRHKIKILLFSIWVMCICNFVGINIDMGIRQYPGDLLCVIQAVSGTFIMCNLSIWIDNIVGLNKFLKYIGKETLLILCIHHIEFNYFYFLWDSVGIIEACLLKCVVIFSILLFIKGIINIKRKFRLTEE
jgi:fucose 4-O-acetylase-like acetyltransferase